MKEQDLFDKSDILLQEAIAINEAVLTAKLAAKDAKRNVKSININKLKKPNKKSKRNKKK